ncbi:AraC family transcriptional regulator, partial [Pseudomonas aeruginosa]|uniref:AraC family transcriptional regulator n=1 Tax=Pseudomonas aeruginosa TaxID=287 RepID=UPI00259CE68C
MDRLSNLLSRFGVRANLFYDGDLCGSASYDGAERRGYIHLLQAGSVTLLGPDRKDLQLTRPSLIFMPRPAKHQLFAGESDGAKLLCASMEFEGGIDNPLSASLPDCLVLALDDLPMLADTLEWMFAEAANVHCGREAALERLFELLIILLLRYLLRVSLAQKLMREGRSITLIAAQVGYESPSALSRAFRRKTGLSPRDWLKDLAGENDGKRPKAL